jgi:hypothetical protein
MSMCIVVVLVVRMRARHGVSGEGGEMIAAVMIRVTVVWVVTRAVVGMVRGQCAFSLDLGGSSCKEVDVEAVAVVRAASLTAMTIGVESRGDVGSVCCEGVRR